jgi:hypothetical protein
LSPTRREQHHHREADRASGARPSDAEVLFQEHAAPVGDAAFGHRTEEAQQAQQQQRTARQRERFLFDAFGAVVGIQHL